MLSGELQCFTLALSIAQTVQLFHISEYSQVLPQSHNIMVKFGNFSIGSDSIWHTLRTFLFNCNTLQTFYVCTVSNSPRKFPVLFL